MREVCLIKNMNYSELRLDLTNIYVTESQHCKTNRPQVSSVFYISVLLGICFIVLYGLTEL